MFSGLLKMMGLIFMYFFSNLIQYLQFLLFLFLFMLKSFFYSVWFFMLWILNPFSDVYFLKFIYSITQSGVHLFFFFYFILFWCWFYIKKKWLEVTKSELPFWQKFTHLLFLIYFKWDIDFYFQVYYHYYIFMFLYIFFLFLYYKYFYNNYRVWFCLMTIFCFLVLLAFFINLLCYIIILTCDDLGYVCSKLPVKKFFIFMALWLMILLNNYKSCK